MRLLILSLRASIDDTAAPEIVSSSHGGDCRESGDLDAVGVVQDPENTKRGQDGNERASGSAIGARDGSAREAQEQRTETNR